MPSLIEHMIRLYFILFLMGITLESRAQQKIRGESGYQRIVMSSYDRDRVNDTRMFTGTSDIDDPDFHLGAPYEHRYALIVGNEKYRHQSRVKFAERDAETFAKYAKKAFLIPADNIINENNLTIAELRNNFKLLSDFAKNDELAELFVFYAGHGVPDKKGYPLLLGVDQNAANLGETLELEYVYNLLLSNTPVKVVVFLDACFSGKSSRGETIGDDLALGTRAARTKNVSRSYTGPILIFSSSEKQQTSNVFNDQGHGLFTYYLLKSIMDANGKLTFGSLSTKVISSVGLQATRMRLEQTPTVRNGSSINGTWFSWKLHK